MSGLEMSISTGEVIGGVAGAAGPFYPGPLQQTPRGSTAPRARRGRGRARRLAASCHRAQVFIPTPHGCRTAGERAGWSLCALPPAPCAPC
jgi:hypothetical protein